MAPQDLFQPASDYHCGIGSLRAQNVDFAWGIAMPPQKTQCFQYVAHVVVTLGKGEVVSSNLTGGSRSLSSAVEHLPYKQAVAGSIPAATIAREGATLKRVSH